MTGKHGKPEQNVEIRDPAEVEWVAHTRSTRQRLRIATEVVRVQLRTMLSWKKLHILLKMISRLHTMRQQCMRHEECEQTIHEEKMSLQKNQFWEMVDLPSKRDYQESTLKPECALHPWCAHSDLRVCINGEKGGILCIADDLLLIERE